MLNLPSTFLNAPEAIADTDSPPVGSRMDRGSRCDCGAGPLASAIFGLGCLTGPARPDRLENGSCLPAWGAIPQAAANFNYGQGTGQARRRGFENR